MKHHSLRYPVLLHGFSGCAEGWGEPIVDGLSGAGLAPVLVDLPGHGGDAGNADPESFTLGSTLELVSAAGDWPTDLIGYSMGARIALHYAAAHPDRVRRLVLESGSPGLADSAERLERRRADQALAARILDQGVAAFLEVWDAQPLFESRRGLGPEVLERQRALKLRNDPRSLAASLIGSGVGVLPALWDALGRIETHTLLIVGQLDAKYVDIAERMAMAMPHARLVVVPDAGHTVHLERPAAWLEAVAGFLS